MLLTNTKITKLSSNIREHILNYRAPANLHGGWVFGSLLLLFWILQVVTGFLLSIYYSASELTAFASVEYIIREVHGGWLIQHIHAIGPSFLFLCLFVHVSRNIFYNVFVFRRTIIWYSGIFAYFFLAAISFLGYVLPWGQMSLWGATVICNLFSIIPVVGGDLVYLLWGSFSVDNNTLMRFYSLHFILPIIGVGLIFMHIIALHIHGSSHVYGGFVCGDSVDFYQDYVSKDVVYAYLVILLYIVVLFFYPYLLVHPDNFVEADSMVTPSKIVPEWYFLPFYAILRSIPNKTAGVLVMLASILCFAVLPKFTPRMASGSRFNELSCLCFGGFAVIFIILGFIGAQPVVEPYTTVGLMFTILYFVALFLMCVALHMESGLCKIESSGTQASWRLSMDRLVSVKIILRWFKAAFFFFYGFICCIAACVFRVWYAIHYVWCFGSFVCFGCMCLSNFSSRK